MQVNIQITGLDEVRNQLGSLGKQANFAASRALNTTAYAVNDRLKRDMASTFKGGATAYTLRAFSVKKADKTTLTAEVALRTDGPGGTGTSYSKALSHLFTGGQRKYKKLEGWLRGRGLLPVGLTIAPGAGMQLDSYGNMRRATLTEMLGVIGAQRANLRVFRKTGAGKAQKAVGYFVVLPGGKTGKHPGIYKRTEAGTASTITPMVLYVDPVSYRKFIDLDKLGREVVSNTFQPAFDAELARALASARP
jgi:hypothetical protein